MATRLKKTISLNKRLDQKLQFDQEMNFNFSIIKDTHLRRLSHSTGFAAIISDKGMRSVAHYNKKKTGM